MENNNKLDEKLQVEVTFKSDFVESYEISNATFRELKKHADENNLRLITYFRSKKFGALIVEVNSTQEINSMMESDKLIDATVFIYKEEYSENNLIFDIS